MLALLRRAIACTAVGVVVLVTTGLPSFALQAAEVRLAVSATTIAVGDLETYTAVSPTGSYRPGDSVAFQRFDGKKWQTFASARLSDRGTAAVSAGNVQAGANSFRVVKAKTNAYSQATSPTVVVQGKVAVQVTAAVEDATLSDDQPVRVGGTVSPVQSGAAVWLQRQTASGWDTLAYSLVTPSGAYVIEFAGLPLGPSALRVLRQEDSTYAQAVSPTVSVTHGSAWDVMATNLSSNPSVESGANGWIDHSGGLTEAIWRRTTQWASSGSWSIQHAGRSGSELLGSDLYGFVGSLQLPSSGAGGYAVTPGQVYTAQTRVNVTDPSESGGGVWQELFFFDSQLNRLAQFNGPSLHTPVGVGEQTVHCTATAPPGAAYVQPVVVMATASTNDYLSFFADATMLLEGSSPVEFFDGDSADSNSNSFEWLGLRHFSASYHLVPVD